VGGYIASAKKKRELGPGADASIGVPPAAGPAVGAPTPAPAADPRFDGIGRPALPVLTVPLEKIEPDPDQHRKSFPPGPIAELAVSLAAHGQLTPVLAYWRAASGKYRLVFGERRYRGAVLAGLPALDMRVLPAEPTPGQVTLWQLEENEQREDVPPLERAQSYAQTMRANGWTQAEFVRRTGYAQSRVAKLLALLTLAPAVRALVGDGSLDWSLAYHLRKLGGPAEQAELAEQAVAGGWSGRQVEEAVARRLAGDAAPAPLPGQATLPLAEDRPAPSLFPGNGRGPEAGAGEGSPGPSLPVAPIARDSPGMDGVARPEAAPGPFLPPAWHRPADFAVTLDDGSEVLVEYDGEPRGTCGGTFTFRGPLNEAGGCEHIPNSWQIRPGTEPREHAEAYAASQAEGFARRREDRAARAKYEATEAALAARHDLGEIAGWDGPDPWFGRDGANYVYRAGDGEGGERGTIHLDVYGPDWGWDRAIGLVEEALLGLRFRRELSRVRPLGARPGDRVECLGASDLFAGRVGEVLAEPGRLITVRFPGDSGLDECEVGLRGEELRRVPWPIEGAVDAGEGGGS
jgi:ParB family chromosome partitioning protein